MTRFRSSSVTASSLAQQGRLDGSSTVITFTFSEELSTEYLDQSDVALRDAVTGTSYYLDSFSYDAATRTLQVTLPELNDGRYTLNLLSGFYAFKDLLGRLRHAKSSKVARNTSHRL